MPSSSKLSSLIRTARICSSKQSPSSAAPAPPSSSLVTSAEKTKLEAVGSSASSSSSSVSHVVPMTLLRLKKSSKPSARSKKSSLKRTGDLQVTNLNLGGSDFDYLARKQLSTDISSVLIDSSPSPNVMPEVEKSSLHTVLDVPWFQTLNPMISLHQKEVSRERKLKWVFKCTQDRRFQQLIKTCTRKIGAEAALTVFGKLGRETGIKEYNAFIDVCIQKARATDDDDDDVASQEIYKAYQLLSLMKERGYQLEEATYGPVLMYMIHMGMEQGFYLVTELVKGDTAYTNSKFSYYEMLLYINMEHGEKIQQLCDNAISSDEDNKHDLIGHYLVALGESGSHREEISRLSDAVDLMSISSRSLLVKIFKSLGRQQRESTAEKFLLAIKDYGGEVKDATDFIFHYAANLPNLLVEDVILKYKNLHKKLEVAPSSTSYGKLITHCCNLHEVYIALDIADEMGEVGLTLSLEVLHAILHACEEAYEYTVVPRIRSLICCQNLSPSHETFRCLINFATRMKDFSAAYDMLKDLEKFNLKHTATIYNTVMAGFFREKNVSGAKMVLRQMEAAGLKPDSQTFSYLISNSDSEEDIVKYYEEMKQGGVQPTKQVYLSLISAYAACGQFEMAKQVIDAKGIPVKYLNEIKSALASALASNDKISDALDVYDEIKRNKGNLEPKAALSIIDSLQREDGQLDRLFEVLKELEDADMESWTDGCCRVLLNCVRFDHISVAVDLLKQLQELIRGDEMGMEVIIDEVFSIVPDGEPALLRSGLDLFRAIKKELGVSPSRKVYDFLLSACVYAKDLKNALFIWREHQDADLPYNVLSFLRMYQALMACGDYKTAQVFRKKIPKDDPHVRYILEEYDKIYVDSASQSTERKKKKKKKKKKKRKG
ncbi:pentatricopeptide repeat-containing protein At4g04790, mitochondrial [Punica granatum]|uniref:Pentatricopeptide repeat-containing protein At4g04790, mitochondrial n=1 Tax=Punica granatum TaxID=22663 RepID=A0A6P8C3G7_PUNGR|nr:pentatricopeptide repeat-containing protein At4g04790, mitochondrial [Punica granatum]